MSNNIVGLDLNIDQNFLADAVKQTVVMGISEALNGKNEVVSQLVNAVLSTKVDKDGKISSYTSDNKFTLLEYHVRNLLKEEIKEETKAIVNEKRVEIREMIRKELNKKSRLDSFVQTFLDNTTEALDSNWRTNIDISFKAKKEEY
jgi:transcription termination factor NusB